MTGPIKIVLLDLDQPLPVVEPSRPDSGQYRTARIFVLRGGCPVGEVTLPFAGRALDPDRLTEGLGRLAALRPAATAVPQPADLPAVTVVVASAFARQQQLRRCVAALSTLDYERFDVVVVDNRRSGARQPGEWEQLGDDPRVRVVAEPRPGASAARNRGLAEATGEIVAFTDDDAVPDRNWLRALVGRFVREPEADCVTGLVLPAELETPAQIWFENSPNAFNQRYTSASYAGQRFRVADRLALDPTRTAPVYAVGNYGTGSNMAFRTAVLRDLGGFNEALGPGTPSQAGEELLVFVRLLARGGRLGFEPAAFIHHWHRREFTELREQVRGYGVGYTAMLAAAVHDDLRHVRGLAGFVRPALSMLTRRPSNTSAHPSTPAETRSNRLGRARMLGMVVGPVAYLRSRRRMRR